jgi:hypothetical protein
VPTREEIWAHEDSENVLLDAHQAADHAFAEGVNRLRAQHPELSVAQAQRHPSVAALRKAYAETSLALAEFRQGGKPGAEHRPQGVAR